ncbi:hypothetical protein KFL_000290510 [Klebsormidium nitens]|uniref:Uncharacterized protein n=1 Tax=Klebsormidium nitens TaxID=105231 RepID=A0A1Y1HQY6_KLENI|nr:hypothetical protein KFL_000290510 [Klebsormidium nitens]|eukprot:GAQ79401.1 hypothetical protein KFL_000290510 [Klebsormidium nitens]
MPLPSEDPRDGEIMTAGVFTRTIRELQYAVGALLRPSRRGPLVPSESAAFAVTPSFPVVATDVRIQEALQRLPARVNPPNGNGSCSARLVTGPSFKTKDIWKAYGIFSASLTAHGDPHDPHAPKASPPSLEDVRWARSVQVDTASAVDAFLDEQQCTAWIVPVCGPLPVFPNPEHKRFHPIGHTKTAY